MAKLVDHSDQGVRKGALQVLGQIYFTIEEDIWKAVGRVSPRVKDLMEKRFKQVKNPQRVASASPTKLRLSPSKRTQKMEQASPPTYEPGPGQ